jgi:glutamyl-tRNA synthetase
MSTPVRVRFAPSPTGYLHVGGLRTALYNWFMARRYGGTFVLRIEDTDRARIVEGAVEALLRTLNACDLAPDEGPFLQSERREMHLAYARELIEKGVAYNCFCSKERLEDASKQQQANKQAVMYDRHCREIPREEAESRIDNGEGHVIRLKVPTSGSIVMEDLIRGRVEIPWEQVDDQVLVKSDGFPTYHLAATCDDHDMKISHVIRGEEWLSSLPKHIFIYQSMGWELPAFAHLPLLLNPDKSKLAKRQGDVAVEDYLARGYLPEALVNFVALLGWNPTADREIFTKEELAQLFDVAKVNKAGAVFNHEKLDWMNGEYIKALTMEDYIRRLAAGGFLSEDVTRERAARVVKGRVTLLSDVPNVIEEMMNVEPHEAERLVWKKSNAVETKERLTGLRSYIENKPESWFARVETMERDLRDFISERGWGNGDTLWPLRVALSGREKSAGPFELMFVAGKGETLARIDGAIEKMS